METRTKWIIDPTHSEIAFKVKHLMITNVRGQFKEFEASIYTIEDDFMTAEIDFWINPASVDTGNADRDIHLKSPDFFDVDQFKEIRFAGNSYEKVDIEGSYEMWGDLTIKGITKKIKLEVEFAGVITDPWGDKKAGFSINGKIHRKDWGLVWNGALDGGGMLLSDEVRISCEVELKKSKTEEVLESSDISTTNVTN
jgi:polyisoprenoid-binding protein YceI